MTTAAPKGSSGMFMSTTSKFSIVHIGEMEIRTTPPPRPPTHRHPHPPRRSHRPTPRHREIHFLRRTWVYSTKVDSQRKQGPKRSPVLNSMSSIMESKLRPYPEHLDSQFQPCLALHRSGPAHQAGYPDDSTHHSDAEFPPTEQEYPSYVQYSTAEA